MYAVIQEKVSASVWAQSPGEEIHFHLHENMEKSFLKGIARAGHQGRQKVSCGDQTLN